MEPAIDHYTRAAQITGIDRNIIKAMVYRYLYRGVRRGKVYALMVMCGGTSTLQSRAADAADYRVNRQVATVWRLTRPEVRQAYAAFYGCDEMLTLIKQEA
jgi:hypothetical protein